METHTQPHLFWISESSFIPETPMSPYVRQPFQALRDFKNEMPVRTLSIHHRLRKGQAGRPSSKPPQPSLAREPMVFVLRTEIRLSSSGNKVIICIREHRSEVRTIEQILSKYSRGYILFSRNCNPDTRSFEMDAMVYPLGHPGALPSLLLHF